MLDLDVARSRIHAHPDGKTERVLRELIVALETGGSIKVADLYRLDYESFRLAIGVLNGWWSQRHIGVARNGIAQHAVSVEQRQAPGAPVA
ncbi:MAG TPA: hypothetical protein VMC81_09665 [Rhodocyclaceae bacterium]|nr:hypothetical protein [Rhodocyclaceae bacterium]